MNPKWLWKYFRNQLKNSLTTRKIKYAGKLLWKFKILALDLDIKYNNNKFNNYLTYYKFDSKIAVQMKPLHCQNNTHVVKYQSVTGFSEKSLAPKRDTLCGLSVLSVTVLYDFSVI